MWYNNKAVRESGEQNRSLKIEQQEIKEVQSKESIVRKNLAILREEKYNSNKK